MFMQYQIISENQVLMNIESVVQEICTTGTLCSESQSFLPSLVEDFLIYRQQNFAIQDKLSYSQSIQAFINAISALVNPYDLGFDQASLYHFMAVIVESRQAISKESKQLIRQEMNNCKSLKEYVTALTRHYSRLLFVRVDLHYYTQNLNLVDCFLFKQHIEMLLAYIQNQDSCFQGLQGYAWALEQGVKKGYHCHLLLMYDGSKHCNDWYLANEVGKKWDYITTGLGYHFNCNTTDYKKKLAKKKNLGIGMIYRDNPEQLNNAIEKVAGYLVNPEKEHQQLRAKYENMRTFGKGHYDVSWRRGIPRL